MEFEESKIIDSNGTKYKVGWDEHGWFTIQRGEFYEDEFYPDDSPLVSLPPDSKDIVIELLESNPF